MDRRFLSIIAVLVLIFGAILIFNRDSSNQDNGSTSKASVTKHTYGEGKKGVTLIEYGDFQCPACAQYYPILKQLKEQHKENITFQFRHFPLTAIHVNAFAGSRAAEAAAKQNKFWEMHDKLYENQNEWAASSNPKQIFEDYATQLGLNLDTFRTDYASSAINDAINADLSEAEKLGASSTPTFVLDGKMLQENPRGLEEFNKLINDAIAAKNSSPTQ